MSKHVYDITIGKDTYTVESDHELSDMDAYKYAQTQAAQEGASAHFEESKKKLAAANANPPEKGKDQGPTGSYAGDVLDYGLKYGKGVAEGTASLLNPNTYIDAGKAVYEGAKQVPKFVQGFSPSDISNAGAMVRDTAQQTVEDPEALGKVVGSTVVAPELAPRSVRLMGPVGRKVEMLGETITPSEAHAVGSLTGVKTGGILPATARVVGRGMQKIASKAGYVPEVEGGTRTFDVGDAGKIKSVPVEGRPNAGTTRVPYQGQEPGPYRASAKAAQKAEDAAAQDAIDAAENKRKLDVINEAKAGKEATTTARESLSATNDAGGKESMSTTYRTPKETVAPDAEPPIYAGGKWITRESNPTLYEAVAGKAKVGESAIPVGETASEGEGSVATPPKSPASPTTGTKRIGGFMSDGEPYTPSDLSAAGPMGARARQGLSDAGFDLAPGRNLADDIASQEGVTAPRTNVPNGRNARPGVSAGQAPEVLGEQTPPPAVSPTARAVEEAGEPGVTAPNLRNVPNGRGARPGASGMTDIGNEPPPSAGAPPPAPRPGVTRVGGQAPAAPAAPPVAPAAVVAPAEAPVAAAAPSGPVQGSIRVGGKPGGTVFAPKPIKPNPELEALWGEHGAEEAAAKFEKAHPGAFGKLPKKMKTNLVRESMAINGTYDSGGILKEDAQRAIDAGLAARATDTAKRAYMLAAPNAPAFNYIFKLLKVARGQGV
jgi:hypothetical protein